jgi:hypothetical protein
VVGVPRSVAEALDARGEKWRINGRYVARSCYYNGFLERVNPQRTRRYALVSFVPRGDVSDS